MPISNSVYSAEIQQRMLAARSEQIEGQTIATQEALQRQFTAKFNRLVGAMASFSKQYGEGKGAVWPRREVEKLREAMRQLMLAEEALQGAPRAAR